MNARNALILFLGLSAPILLGGCAGKAEALRVSVAQFEVESLAAINAIDEMRDAELASVPMSPSEASNNFAKNVLEDDKPATSENVDFWMDPDKVNIDPQEEQRWDDLMACLREQYGTFARIFDSIEQASFTAREKVGKAQPQIEILTAQMSGFADAISRHPPVFLSRRNALLAELEDIRERGPQADPAKQRLDVQEWRDRWLALRAEEEALTRETIVQSLKAATIGLSVRQQIVAYDQLSVEDISEGAALALRLAGAVSGQDLSSLENDVMRIKAEIEDDPDWKRATEVLLREVNSAIARRNLEAAGEGVPGEAGGTTGSQTDRPPRTRCGREMTATTG